MGACGEQGSRAGGRALALSAVRSPFRPGEKLLFAAAGAGLTGATLKVGVSSKACALR